MFSSTGQNHELKIVMHVLPNMADIVNLSSLFRRKEGYKNRFSFCLIQHSWYQRHVPIVNIKKLQAKYGSHSTVRSLIKFRRLDSMWSLWNWLQSVTPVPLLPTPPSSGFLGILLLLNHCHLGIQYCCVVRHFLPYELSWTFVCCLSVCHNFLKGRGPLPAPIGTLFYSVQK